METDLTTPCDPLPREAPCGLPACQQLLRDARQQVGFYKTLHQRALQREAKLKEQLAHCHTACDARLTQRDREHQQHTAALEAEVRLLKQRLYGRKSEAHHVPNTLAGDAHAPDDAGPDAAGNAAASPGPSPPRRRRGQQPGRKSHPRRHHDHLPATDETAALPPDQCHCTTCGLPFAPCGSEPEVTTILEVEVRAHRRLVRRRRYRPTCGCGTHPALMAAPPPPRLIPKSALGVSVWVTVLLDKYAFHRPTYRLLADWRLSGLDLALGTLTDGLQRVLPLLEPVYQALRTHNQQQTHWHGDETRWQVFATVEGKVGHLWYLWLVMSAEAAVFELASGRAHEVPEEVLGPQAQGIFNVDRYPAYPAMQQVKDGQITLALCWAHVRRDFIEVERGRPELHDWASAWLERIRTLYRLNAARLQEGGPSQPPVVAPLTPPATDPIERREGGPPAPPAVAPAAPPLPAAVGEPSPATPAPAPAAAAAPQPLQAAIAAMAQASAQEQAAAALPLACRKVLQSLDAHWPGLTVFVEHPEVPMDNNAAERAERGPVVGRKNYYGSGAVWAGQLAAVMFSVLQTLQLWDLNARQWLTGYLTACAENGGQAVPDLRPWLPWSMTEAERAALKVAGSAQARPPEDSS